MTDLPDKLSFAFNTGSFCRIRNDFVRSSAALCIRIKTSPAEFIIEQGKRAQTWALQPRSSIYLAWLERGTGFAIGDSHNQRIARIGSHYAIKEIAVLVLTRKQNETLHIGDDIVITIVRARGNSIRIGIEAPTSINIQRGELVGKPAKQAVASETNECEKGQPDVAAKTFR